MSTALEQKPNGVSIHPRVSNLAHSESLDSHNGNGSLSIIDERRGSEESSGRPSGTSTPIPFDAPPSVQATSSARKHVRDEQKKRMFPTVEFAARVSHFDPRSEYRDFRGFFVLFWVGLAIMVSTTMIRNIKETGYPFQMRQRQTFLANIWELAISDLTMTLSAALVLPLHKLYAKSNGWLRWKNGGKWVQSAFQAAWLLHWVDWPFMRSWTWTSQVFLTLHLLVLFMKMHSYAFYNGHLSEVKRRLDELDSPDVVSVKSIKKPTRLVRYPSSSTHLNEYRESLNAASTQQPIKTLRELREDLALEITSPLGHVNYPQNLTVANLCDFACCPTLCYELEYPRTDAINFVELGWKTLAVFGCIFLMTVTTEEFVMPVLDEAAISLQSVSQLSEGALIFAEAISRLLFPFMVIFLLVFLVIFEYILGAFAEITCFADRHFYEDWWNSCDWLEFSREWNIPVHHFFRRHVYMASRSVVSRPAATVITFFISALAHELVMGCITKKLRGYGAVALLLQMPIVLVQRSRLLRGRTLLNNILFWCSMISGLAIMCALYVLL